MAAANRYTAPVHIDVGGTIYTSSLETLTKWVAIILFIFYSYLISYAQLAKIYIENLHRDQEKHEYSFKGWNIEKENIQKLVVTFSF